METFLIRPHFKDGHCGLYGAIIGDICGSIYEFNNRKTDKPEEIDLINSDCFFTDDTVLTVAVTEVAATAHETKTTVDDYNKSLHKWGRKYPYKGYGNRFRGWLDSDDPKPYNSFGNGSAMRVSPIGYLFEEDQNHEGRYACWREAERSALPTHNHPEGIKGAQAVAWAIQLARVSASQQSSLTQHNNEDKQKIAEMISVAFGYDLNQTLAQIRPHYKFDETCQRTVPQAIIAFLESHDFVSAIQNAISIGGDSDTIACITGSIAEAFYQEIPKELIEFAKSKLPDDIQKVMGYTLSGNK
ncbi:MAG: ADP-ribosylglycohydrolase family protein [Planctomycetaceae bacterium]|jgi:ADP-ribosylglycohydrolase|nr:ADP-ribosylglycohydrolase family protein [Planctomycetaceae bacterium]